MYSNSSHAASPSTASASRGNHRCGHEEMPLNADRIAQPDFQLQVVHVLIGEPAQASQFVLGRSGTPSRRTSNCQLPASSGRPRQCNSRGKDWPA